MDPVQTGNPPLRAGWKKSVPMVLFLAFLSCISGYLMSKPSFIGRVGMDLFYKEYKFLKIWWQGALSVFSVLTLLFLIQGYVRKKVSRRNNLFIQLILLIGSIAGFYFTYDDFHSTTTHRWLKERFHIGAYLFWAGWSVICVFHFIQGYKPRSGDAN